MPNIPNSGKILHLRNTLATRETCYRKEPFLCDVLNTAIVLYDLSAIADYVKNVKAKFPLEMNKHM